MRGRSPRAAALIRLAHCFLADKTSKVIADHAMLQLQPQSDRYSEAAVDAAADSPSWAGLVDTAGASTSGS